MRGATGIFAARIVGAAATFVAHVLIARWIGAAALGAYAWAFSIAMLSGAMVCCGLNVCAPRFVSVAPNDNADAWVNGFFVRSFQITLIASCLCVLLVSAGVRLAKGLLPAELVVALGVIPIFGLLRLCNGIYVAQRSFALAFVPNQVVRPVLFMALAFVAVVLGAALTPAMIVGLQLATAVPVAAFSVGVLFVRFVPRLKRRPPRFDTGMWLRASMPLLASIAFMSFLPDIALVLLGAFLDHRDIGILSATLRLAMVVTFALNAIDSYVSAQIAEHARNEAWSKLGVLCVRAARIRACAACAGAVSFVAAGDWLLRMFGDEFLAGYPLLVVLGLGQLFVSIYGPCAQILALSGRQSTCFWAALAGLAALVVGCVVAVPVAGLLGAGMAIVFANAVWIVLLYRGVRTRTSARSAVWDGSSLRS